MRRLLCAVGVLWLLAPTMAQEVRLALSFFPESSATRIITGKVTGEWFGPTPLSPTRPVSFSYSLSVRAQSLLTVKEVTANGDGVVTMLPQGLEVTGTAGDQAFELRVSADGDVRFTWGALSFDSTKLPAGERKKLQQLLTLPVTLTLSPQGKIQAVQLPETLKDIVPGLDVQFVNAFLTAVVQTLLPAPLPSEPVKVGKSWQVVLPVLAFETPEPLSLPITCTLAEVRGDEAVITVKAEAVGDADLVLRRWKETDPKVTVTSGRFVAQGEAIFLLTFGVPQRATWRVQAEAEGFITPSAKDAATVPFRLRLTAEWRDQLAF